MPLPAGTRLGPYEIVASIGAGGMGEVYEATDTRLDRTVAIKVLPEHVAESPERKERFELEAKAISQLNHAHICTLYDVGNEGGVDFLVMEYLEGETLADRLRKTTLSVDEALEFGIEIASGLDAAHRAGIVHRDLKPANIMLTRSGVKLLDFGLAKQLDVEPVAAEAPTKQQGLTREHAIIGTLPYMAPEQLDGKQADERTDLFAFGSLLYEMVTGKRAFAGTEPATVMAAIIKSDPEPTGEAGLERVLHHCFEKDPEQRWQSAWDIAIQLKAIHQSREVALDTRSAGWRRPAWIAAAVIAAGVVGLVVGVLGTDTEDARQTYRLSVLAPEGTTFGGGYVGTQTPVLSPDGRRIAIIATNAAGSQLLWVRSLDDAEARALPGTDGAYYPFWSPDGTVVGYFASGQLKKIQLAGGPPVSLAQAPQSRGGTFGSNGELILFSPNIAGPLYRIPAVGGAPEPVTRLDPERLEVSHRLPSFLPDGKRSVRRPER